MTANYIKMKFFQIQGIKTQTIKNLHLFDDVRILTLCKKLKLDMGTINYEKRRKF